MDASDHGSCACPSSQPTIVRTFAKSLVIMMNDEMFCHKQGAMTGDQYNCLELPGQLMLYSWVPKYWYCKPL
jgi:hypothetical protein